MIVGLTGGIATGKSVIAEEMATKDGVRAVELDQLAWRTYRKNTPVYKSLVDHFGQKILKPDGAISRGKLGEIVFNDEKELEFLDRTVHPVVTKKLYKLIDWEKKQNTIVLVIVAALLLEAKSLDENIFDYIVVADSERKKRIKRLMKRDNLSKEEALKRINAQPPHHPKLKRADYIIDTSDSLEETRKQAMSLINFLADEAKAEK